MAANAREVVKEIKNKKFDGLVQIGAGNFGIVYRGFWKRDLHSPSILVAFKVPKEQKDIEELFKEASIMETIIHKNIVRFFGIHNIEIGKRITEAIITEYMTEGNVADFLKKVTKQYLKPLDILTIAMEAAMGMRYLHERSIIH